MDDESNRQQNQNQVELKPISNETKAKGINLKSMSIEEQCTYYKTMLQKSKKLNQYFDEENKKLQGKLNQYEGENGKVCELLFVFKYDNQWFYFFKNDTSHYFISDKLLAESFVREIKSNPSIKTYDYTIDLKSKDDYLNQIINQYDDKLRRIAEENEKNESKATSIKSSLDNMTNQFNEAQLNYETAIKESIQNSNEILVRLKNIFDVDLTDELLKKEVYLKLKANIEQLSTNNNSNKQESLNNTLKWSKELNAFHSKILMTYLDTVFKCIDNDIEANADKKKWQVTIDQLLISHEEDKKMLIKTIEQQKGNIKQLGQKINTVEHEKFSVAKQKDQTIAMLNKQLNNGVNMNYLKNIFISFLTTKDSSIQEGLLPVIFTSLQFNESEIKQVKDERSKNTSSLFSYFTK